MLPPLARLGELRLSEPDIAFLQKHPSDPLAHLMIRMDAARDALDTPERHACRLARLLLRRGAPAVQLRFASAGFALPAEILAMAERAQPPPGIDSS